MEEDFVSSGIHVACDTNIVRSVIEGNAFWLEDFKKMAAQGVTFSLMDHAVAELTKQLENKDFTEAGYAAGMAECAKFISPDVPILPGKKHLLQWCSDAPDLKELATDHALRSAQWQLISTAKTLGDFSRNFEFEDGNGSRQKIAFNPEVASTALEDERSRWIAHVDKDRPDWEKETVDKRLGKLAGELDSDLQCSPPLTIRLDAALRHEDQVICARNKKNGPLKPTSNKRLNDGIDYNMAYVFMKKLLLCTEEKKYTNAIRNVGSYQSDWIYRPEELVKAWNDGKLRRPDWPKASNP